MANPPSQEGEQSETAPSAGAGYLGPIERLVAHAAAEVRLLATLTPTNAEEERARLTADLRAGRPAVPRWKYAPRENASLRHALEGAEWALDRLGATPLSAEYRARVIELCVELGLCAAAGKKELGA